MKKILSFVLVLAMVLGSVSMAFAATSASFPDVDGTESYAEAANVLKAVGVLEGNNAGLFQGDRQIKRSEAVKMVVVAMGLPVKEGNAYKTVFEDVPETAWYSGYVYWATTLGITEGTTPTTFRPDQMVTYDQMITFAMRALGYNDNLPGGYPAGYVFKAFTLAKEDGKNTYDHVPTGSAPATRGDCAEIIYAIMDECFVQYSKDLNDFQVRHYDNEATQTPFERLGCEVLDAALIDNEDVADSELVDLSGFLGSEAHLIVKDDEVVGVGKVETEFLTGDDGTKIGGKKLEDGALDDVVTFENGEATTTGGSIKLNKEAAAVYAVKYGKNGKIGEVVSKQIWTPTVSAKMTEEQVEALNIGDKNETGEYKLLGKEFKLDDDKEVITSAFILDGAKSLADIKEDDVVIVYVGPKSEKITKVTVSDKVVTGKLTAVNSSKGTFTIDGATYKISDALGDGDKIASVDDNKLDKATVADAATKIRGTEINAYLDADGKIYYTESTEVTKDNTVYAIFLAKDAAKEGTSKSRNNGEIEILNADGEQEFIEFASKEWNTSCKAIAGDLVKIVKTSAGRVKDVVVASDEITSAASISKKGVVDPGDKGEKLALPTNATIFSWNGKDANNYKNYSIISASKLYNTKGTEMKIFNDNGDLVAGLMKGDVSSKDTNVVVFTAWNYGNGKDLWDAKGYENGTTGSWTYKNSEIDSLENLKDAAGNKIVTVGKTTDAIAFYTLEFDSSENVTAINSYAYAPVKLDTEVTALDNKSKTSVSSNNVVKIGEQSYELADNVVVYVWTPDGKKNDKGQATGTWSITKSTSKLANLYKDNTESLQLFNNDGDTDTVYDAAIVIRK